MPSKNHSIANKKLQMEMLVDKKIILPVQIQNALINSHLSSDKDGNIAIGKELKKNGTIFKSACSKQIKSVDSFIQLIDKSIGEIQCFVKSDNIYCVVEIYNLIKSYHHLNQIEPTRVYKIFPCSDIEEKLLYLKYIYSRIATVHIVTREPNIYERN